MHQPSPPLSATAAPDTDLLAGALSLLMQHELSGCAQAARRAATLLDRLADDPGVDRETRNLCERMSARLSTGCFALAGSAA